MKPYTSKFSEGEDSAQEWKLNIENMFSQVEGLLDDANEWKSSAPSRYEQSFEEFIEYLVSAKEKLENITGRD